MLHNLQIVNREIGTLVPYAKNSKQHPESQILEIVASIREFGMINPVLIDEDGGIIAGHGRVLACERLGLTHIPTITLAHLDERQRRAYVIADNKLGENGRWDLETLAGELSDLSALQFDVSVLGFSDQELDALLTNEIDVLPESWGGTNTKPSGLPSGGTSDRPAKEVRVGSLAERFLIPPFSVFDARQGWWQERKRAWLRLGIQSEIGRGSNTGAVPGNERDLLGGMGTHAGRDGNLLGFSAAAGEKGLNHYRNKNGLLGFSEQARPRYAGGNATSFDSQARLTALQKTGSSRAEAFGTAGTMDYVGGAGEMTGTSIFDPVVCEIAYRWFCPAGGSILDPFAGGSVRGIVAGKLGRRYTGIELRAEQVAANEEQSRAIFGLPDVVPVGEVAPHWIVGDSQKMHKILKPLPGDDGLFDMVFTCPPYADLEVYSNDPADLSNMPYMEFIAAYRRIIAAYRRIIAAACQRLRPNSFAVVVVGEVRGENGNYYGFVPDTIDAFSDAGLAFYNEAILLTAIGSLPVRAGRPFVATRKLGKTHQNILVFLKGDARLAAERLGDIGEFDFKNDYDGDTQNDIEA